MEYQNFGVDRFPIGAEDCFEDTAADHDFFRGGSMYTYVIYVDRVPISSSGVHGASDVVGVYVRIVVAISQPFELVEVGG